MSPVLLLVLLARIVTGDNGPVIIDVVKNYGATFTGIGSAMSHAQAIIGGGSSATLYFRAGNYTIDMSGDLFNVSTPSIADSVAGNVAVLTVAGAGMDDTYLTVVTHGFAVIHGRPFKDVAFENLTFARPGQTTAQAAVLATTNTSIDLEILPGFPGFDKLLQDRYPRLKQEQGLFLRLFAVHNGYPTLITGPDGGAHWPPSANEQVHFACDAESTGLHNGTAWICPNITRLAPQRWRLSIRKWPDGGLRDYTAARGSSSVFVAIKVKHGGQTFELLEGSGIAFRNVRWTGHSRGVVRDCHNVEFRNTRVDRETDVDGQIPFLSTNGGGPQILGYSFASQNVTVVNHTSVGTGDDSVALFNVASGLVSDCHIADSFARGILLCAVGPAVVVQNNSMTRCPIYRPKAKTYNDCS